MSIHEEILSIQNTFKKAILMKSYKNMITIINEIAMANYCVDIEYLKILIDNFKNKNYNIISKYELNKNVYSAENIIRQMESNQENLSIEDYLIQIGYAESSIKKLIKEYKNENNLEGTEYILAVLDTIPNRSKYRKTANIIIKQLGGDA